MKESGSTINEYLNVIGLGCRSKGRGGLFGDMNNGLVEVFPLI